MDRDQPSHRSGQLEMSLALLAAICLTCLGVGLAAHFSPVMSNYAAAELARQRAVNGMYFYNGGYVDDGDYVLLGQLPHDDFSRGGVYFIGASEMKISIMPWLLPPAERALIHNYSVGDLRHRDVLHYLRVLVEEHGLLKAGGEKTTVFLGLSYQMTRNRDFTQEVNRFVPKLFTRHGLYTYDVAQGVHRVPMTPLEAFLRRERVYANRFLQVLPGPKSRVVDKPTKPAEFHQYLVNAMGPDWRGEMRRQAQYVGSAIDYLQARGVHVRVVFPPTGSWHEDLPYDQAYRQALAPILTSRGVTVVDLQDLLPDGDFGDAVHARYSGEAKLHATYRKLALQALADMGTTPAPDPAPPAAAKSRTE